MGDLAYSHIDFVSGEICYKCHRPLRSGRVTVLVDNLGVEYFFGPDCAVVASGPRPAKLPDLTKLLGRFQDEPPTVGQPGIEEGVDENSKNPKKRGAPAETFRNDTVVKYLLLRCVKLTDFKDVRFEKLVAIYQSFRSGDLSEEQIGYVESLLAYTAEKRPLLALPNLEAVYAYNYWLKHLVNEKTKLSKKVDYLLSVLTNLKEKLYLSIAQIERINADMVQLGLPELDKRAFAEAIKQEMANSKANKSKL